MSSKKHDVPEALLTSLLANYQKPEDLIGENGLLKQLTKLLVERALDAEMSNWAVSGLEDTLLRCQIQPEYLNGHYQKEVQQGI